MQPQSHTVAAAATYGCRYEHAFHDYTQFSDVYDTTLDIELSADGTRWLDDFALRGEPNP